MEEINPSDELKYAAFFAAQLALSVAWKWWLFVPFELGFTVYHAHRYWRSR